MIASRFICQEPFIIWSHPLRHSRIILKRVSWFLRILLATNSNSIHPQIRTRSKMQSVKRLEAKVPRFIFASNSLVMTFCLVGSYRYVVRLIDSGFVLCTEPSPCFNETSWQQNFTSVLKLTISQHRASVAYSRENDTILDVFDLGIPEPTHYLPGDFFAFFIMAMSNVTGNDVGQYYISWAAGYRNFVDENYGSNDPYVNSFFLMDLLAVPVGQLNDPAWYGTYPPENRNSSASLAVPSYRVYLISCQS